MRVVRHKRKGADARARAFGKQPHPVQKGFPVRIVPEDAPVFDPPDDHMMQGSRRIKSRSSRHGVEGFCLLAELLFSNIRNALNSSLY
jgi:hypothetical protein